MSAAQNATNHAGLGVAGLHRATHFRLLLPLLIAVPLLARPADGVERYRAVALPDQGNGSSANSFTTPTGADRMELMDVVGSMRLNDGRSVPVHWAANPIHGMAMVTQLPIPANATGEATGGIIDDQSLPLLCGTVTTGDGVRHATVWISGEGGLFEAVSLTELGHGSRAHGLTPSIGAERGDVVGEMTLPSGRSVPVVWSIDFDTSEITREELPLPPGTEGTANSITQTARGALIAVGTLAGGGQTRAVQWSHDGEGWSGAPLPTPRRADSTANFVDGFESGELLVVATVGAVCEEGLCSATMWRPGGVPVNLHTRPGFIDSIANGFFIDLGGAFGVVGRMTDAEGDVGALFLPQVNLAADINQLLVNPGDVQVTEVNAVGPGGLMVGTGVKGALQPVNCGIVLLPVGSFVAQELGVPVGKVTGGDVTSTWRDDNHRLRLKPGGAQRGRTISAHFDSQPIGSMDLPEPFVHSLCNGRAKDQSSTFDVRVQVFNFLTDEWQTIGQFEATTTETAFSLEAPSATLAERDGMKIRLHIHRTAGRGRWEFEINGFMLSGEEDSY